MVADKSVIRLIKVGNSSGLIIKKKILQQAGIKQDADLHISVQNGQIIIQSAKFKSSKLKFLKKV